MIDTVLVGVLVGEVLLDLVSVTLLVVDTVPEAELESEIEPVADMLTESVVLGDIDVVTVLVMVNVAV